MHIRKFAIARIALVCLAVPSFWCAAEGAKKPIQPMSAKKFDVAADRALDAMQKHAAGIQVTGVAAVVFAPGDAVTGWRSKMLVVGRKHDDPKPGYNGSDYLAIVYSKIAEMADTLKDSGSGARPPMTGEFGWQGGVIARTRNGFIIVAFSGGKGEEDLAISQAGLALLKDKF